ncbi:hypothetical protein [Billgrantia antri]|uniref:hypothetical protein n=1 Tax=Billgrantia antri TaxID=2846777 RepID=UPI003B213338
MWLLTDEHRNEHDDREQEKAGETGNSNLRSPVEFHGARSKQRPFREEVLVEVLAISSNEVHPHEPSFDHEGLAPGIALMKQGLPFIERARLKKRHDRVDDVAVF